MKKIVKVCCFIAILAICVMSAYKVLSMKDTMGLVGSSVKQLEYTEDNMIDVAFVGSSHVFAGISPATLWNEFGIASFSMSVSGMDMDSAYYYLKHLLKTQSPKYVFVDLFSFVVDKHALTENVYRNFLSMPYSKNSYDHINSYFDEGSEEKVDYILKWPLIHSRYKEVNYTDFLDLDFARYGRGERVIFQSSQSYDLTNVKVKDIAELGEKRIQWLENIQALAEEEDFELVFMVVPFSASYEAQTYINAAKQYALEQGITCLDFNEMYEEVGLSYCDDVSDSTHLNTYGAEKLSRWIGNYLVCEKDVATHNGEVGYEYWDLDYAYLNHMKSIDTLSKMYPSQPETFFDVLDNIPGISYVISLDGGNQDVYECYLDYFGILGISSEDAMEGGVWVKLRGEEMKRVDCTDDKIYYADFDEINSVRINRDSETTVTSVLISDIDANANRYGLSIAVYDNINHRYLRSFGW